MGFKAGTNSGARSSFVQCSPRVLDKRETVVELMI